MKGKQRHPTTALVSSGLIITLALLPLYLGQLEQFRKYIGGGARLIGLFVAVMAFLAGAWSILSHPGRLKAVGAADEPAATETWLKTVDLVWKFAAAIAVIVITNWFAVVVKQEQDRQKKNEERANEKIKAETESKAQADAAAAKIRESVIQLLTNQEAYVRLIAVANAADLVTNHRPSGLSAAETLFTVALNDPNERVKTAAAKCLPTGVVDVQEKFDFSKAILQLAEKQASPDRSKVRDYRLLDALNTVRQFATDPADQSSAEALAAKLSQSEIPEATKASDTYVKNEQASTTRPNTTEQQKVDTFAPAVVLAAANTADQKKAKEASAILQNTSAEAVTTSIQKLPESVVTKLPARVYLHIADENQRRQAKTWQSALTNSGYVSPGIQNVAGKGYSPDTLEVRYFDENSRSAAENVLEILKRSGAKDGRASYVIPTANDLRIWPDIKSHFEVWAGKNSL